MSMIYISHDIAVIAEVSERIGVMYAGQMAEMADAVDIFERPLHPYTYALMSRFPQHQGASTNLAAAARRTARPAQPAPRLPLPPTLSVGHRHLPAGGSRRSRTTATGTMPPAGTRWR